MFSPALYSISNLSGSGDARSAIRDIVQGFYGECGMRGGYFEVHGIGPEVGGMSSELPSCDELIFACKPSTTIPCADGAPVRVWSSRCVMVRQSPISILSLTYHHED